MEPEKCIVELQIVLKRTCDTSGIDSEEVTAAREVLERLGWVDDKELHSGLKFDGHGDCAGRILDFGGDAYVFGNFLGYSYPRYKSESSEDESETWYMRRLRECC